jgi:hypothetical protein
VIEDRGDEFPGRRGSHFVIPVAGVYRLSVSVLNIHDKPYPQFGLALRARLRVDGRQTKRR